MRVSLWGGGFPVARVVHGCDAEVGEDDAAGGVEQDVGGLHVPVQDARAVGGRECLEDLGADGGGFGGLQDAALAQDVVEGGSVDEFHDDDGAALVFGDVVDGDDRGVADAGGRACFALHPQAEVAQFGCGGVVIGAQFLDGDFAAEDFVVGAPHDAHAAAAELLDDPVPAGQ